MAYALCMASNCGWIVISLIGVMGSIGHLNADKLFLYRYSLALVSSVLSISAIRYFRIRWLGKLSIYMFLPFIVLQLAEIWIVYKCEGGLSSYWDVDCSTLLIYPDGAKVVQVITDELAVFLLSIANLFLLIDCHILHGHQLYDMPKNVNRQPFLSAVSCDEDGFLSAAEEGEEGNYGGVVSKAVVGFQTKFQRGRSMSHPALVQSVNDLNSHEVKAITDMQQAELVSSYSSVVSRFGVHDWLKLAWARSLDSTKSAELVKYHKEFIDRFKLDQIPLHRVKENFKAGFSVLAGRDFDGRPMLWQRMQFMTPSTIPLDVGIKSTWLALDAALADLESNRVGVCLIYDFTDVGMKNISLNLFDVRDGSLACGAGHPSHISRVILLNTPFVFRMGFNAAKPLLPTALASVIQMIDSHSNANWCDNLCPRTQLPEYLGGEQKGDYFAWLSRRLEGSNLMYHPEPILPDTAAIGQ